MSTTIQRALYLQNPSAQGVGGGVDMHAAMGNNDLGSIRFYAPTGGASLVQIVASPDEGTSNGVTVLRGGNVGIGTTSPKGKLEIQNGQSVSGAYIENIQHSATRILADNTGWQTILTVPINNYGGAVVEVYTRLQGNQGENVYGVYYYKWVIKKIFGGGLIVTAVDSSAATEVGVVTNIQYTTSGTGSTSNFLVQVSKSVGDAGFRSASVFRIMGNDIGTVTYP